MIYRHGWTHLPIISFAIIAMPIAFYILSDILFLIFGWHGPRIAPLSDQSFDARADASARLLVLAAILAVIGVGCFAICRFITDLHRMPARVSGPLLLGLATGVTITLIYSITLGQCIPIIDYLGDGFMHSALSAFDKSEGHAAHTLGRGSISLALRFDKLMTWVRLFLILSSAAVIVGAASCLALPPSDSPEAEQAAALLAQRQRLRNYANLGAILMVSGMLFMLAWMHWPGALLPKAAAQAFIRHVNALGLYFGVTYSLMIAAYTLPTATILHERSLAIGNAPNTGEDRSLLGKGMVDGLGKILVILAPTLAGAVPAVIELLKSLSGDS